MHREKQLLHTTEHTLVLGVGGGGEAAWELQYELLMVMKSIYKHRTRDKFHPQACTFKDP